MTKYLFAIIITCTVGINIIAGCGVKTISQKKDNLEMKNLVKNELIEPIVQDSKPVVESPSVLIEEDLVRDNNIKQNPEPKFEKQSNPFEQSNLNNGQKDDSTLRYVLTEKLDDIFFDYDQYNIDIIAKKTLIKNAEWLKQHPKYNVQLAGHCDERGTNNYNIALGEKRSVYIKNQLSYLGISINRLIPISYGEEKPICHEFKEECWSKNRRVQFLISAKD